ncbi:MAG: large conductance mechanosensitive channel protein MscL [Acidimicrobiales bacterium]|nr:large conductance mechanosensitive channel protein MscL [Acidimicrobiales bacterium]
MVEGFKKFIMGGNVVDLAVGVVIGAAFAAVVTQFTASFIEPLIALIAGGGVDGGTFTIDDQVFDYGAFINAIITFLLTAAAIYFVVVVPINAMRERRAAGEDEDVEPTNEEKIVTLLEQIASK